MMFQLKKHVLKAFVWFEENTDNIYYNTINIALSIWVILLFLIIILFGYFMITFEVLPLSAIAISLSAMIASLMAWYNIETTKRTVQKQKSDEISKEYLSFYTHSFRLSRMLIESIRYEKHILPDEIPQMIVYAVQQYLDNYPSFSKFHSLLNADEKRRLEEQIWGLHHDLAKLKRTVASKDSLESRKTIQSAQKSLFSIINKILKRVFDENKFIEHFDNTSRGR